jgi:hypothetical protein
MDRADHRVAIFAIVNEHYRNDFHLFWQRTRFFLLLQAGMLGFYFSQFISPGAINRPPLERTRSRSAK